jgi:hypothetical protein
MDKSEIKAAILSAVSEEVDLLLEKIETVKDGYEYETEFINTTRQIGKIMLEKSLGEVSSNRKKKEKFRPSSEKLK